MRAALRLRRGVQHELHRLGNQHEVAAHLRVGDGDRAALLDLLEEPRHHAAVAAEHVAEAHDRERRAAAHGLRLDDQLGDALGRAHDARRVHRLVGRDQDEALDAVRVGRLGQQPRAAHVVLHRLARVLLHQRHVLVRGGVEDDLRPVLREHRVDPRGVGHVADHRDDAERRACWSSSSMRIAWRLFS